jgi:hypothetical protein
MTKLTTTDDVTKAMIETLTSVETATQRLLEIEARVSNDMG